MTEHKLHIQLFPHSPNQSQPFLFAPVELSISPGAVYSIGRKIDKNRTTKPLTREDRSANNVLVSIDKPSITFRSKVVSRSHAELWVGKDMQVYFKDVGSSSGTFLNHLRLSPSGKDSRPYPLSSEDVIQLGVDYQGRQEDFHQERPGNACQDKSQEVLHLTRLAKALKSLLFAMNPHNDEIETTTTDCCICLNSMAPFQALFLAPCSHCFHYKCVTPLLGAGFMFQCPMCRQVANLEANVASDEVSEYISEDEMDIEDSNPQAVDGMATLGRPKLKQAADIDVVDRSQTVRNQDAPQDAQQDAQQDARQDSQLLPLDTNMAVSDPEAAENLGPNTATDAGAASNTITQAINLGPVDSATSNVTLNSISVARQFLDRESEEMQMPSSSQAIPMNVVTQDLPDPSDAMSPSTPPSFSWAMPQDTGSDTLPLVLYRLLTDFEQSLTRQDANSSRALIASYASSMARFLQQAPISDEFRQELQQILNK